MTEIKFDDTAMQQIVTKAILEGLGDDQRDLIIAQAVQHLTTVPPSTGYGHKPKTPLQEAFDLAASRICMRVADDILTERPEFADQVKTLMVEAATEALTKDSGSWNGLRQSMAEALGSALDRNRC